jgi:hypothetical protein
MADRFGGEPVKEPVSKDRFGGIPADVKKQNTEPFPVSDKREEYSPGQIGEAAGAGGVAGFFAPELMETAGVGLGAAGRAAQGMPGIGGFLGKAATGLGTGLIAGGEALRGSRLASGAVGAISGAGGETAGQAVEQEVGPGVRAETARLLGSVVAPLPLQALGTTAGKALSTGLGLVSPGWKAARTLGGFLEGKGIAAQEVQNLSAESKRLLEEKIKDLRGGGDRSRAAEKDIVELFKKEGARITGGAEQQARNLETQANQLIKEAEAAGGKLTADMEKRVANLKSQWDAAADKLRNDAQAEAMTRVQAGAKRAAIIRKNAEKATGTEKSMAELDAQTVISNAQREADAVMKDSAQKIAEQTSRIEKQQDRLRRFSKVSEQFRAGQTEAIGERILPTDLGAQVRTHFDSALSKIKETREAVTKPFKDAWLNTVKAQEERGITYRETPAYKEALVAVRSEKTDPTTGMLKVTDPKSAKQIDDVVSQINPRRESVNEAGEKVVTQVKASADALDTLLRRLKDRARGLPAEGVEAIDQQLAGRLAGHVEKIIDEFSGANYSAFKNAWRDASKPLNDFRTKLGSSVTDKPEGFDLGNYLEKLSQVGGQAFSSKNAAKQLVSVAGPDESKRLASGYLADQIGDGSPAKIKSVLDSNRDWLALPEFKDLRNSLEAISKNLASAKTQEERASILGKALGVRMGQLPAAPVKEAGRIEAAGARKAGAIESASEKKVREIEAEAARRTAQYAPSTGSVREGVESQISTIAPKVEAQVGALRGEAKSAAEAQAKAAAGQAAPLTAEAGSVRKAAADKVNTLLANTTNETRFEQIVLGTNQQEWEAMAQVINSTPGAKAKFAEGIGQVVSRAAEGSLKGARLKMDAMGDRLISFGMMDKPAVDALKAKLNDIYLTPINAPEKLKLIDLAIRRAITGATTGYVANVPGRVVEKVTQ